VSSVAPTTTTAATTAAAAASCNSSSNISSSNFNENDNIADNGQTKEGSQLERYKARHTKL